LATGGGALPVLRVANFHFRTTPSAELHPRLRQTARYGLPNCFFLFVVSLNYEQILIKSQKVSLYFRVYFSMRYQIVLSCQNEFSFRFQVTVSYRNEFSTHFQVTLTLQNEFLPHFQIIPPCQNDFSLRFQVTLTFQNAFHLLFWTLSQSSELIVCRSQSP
jgi:hypothetical protein